MSVDEFSKQILERLDKNNSDVMFLYNMVTETKEELKSEIANAKKTEESLRSAAEAYREVQTEAAEAELTKSLHTEKRETKKEAAEKTKQIRAKTEKKAQEVKKPMPPVEDISDLLAATVREIEEDEISHDMPKERILELHKKGKSIREISRELGMGQGEVKLVIDLYGA